MTRRPFISRARDGAVISAWMTLSDPLLAETLGALAFDAVCVDAQHGLVDGAAMASLVRGVELASKPFFVRVAENDVHAIGRSLDAGAAGVIVPMVETAADAARAVAACRYPPAGVRSWGPSVVSLRHVTVSPVSENERVLCMVMVETAAGLENVRHIASTPGVDGIFVGPNDLALSMLSRSPISFLDEPAVLQALQEIADVCANNAIIAGIYCNTAELAVIWRSAGYSFLAVESDLSFVCQGAARAIQVLSGSDDQRDAGAGYIVSSRTQPANGQ